MLEQDMSNAIKDMEKQKEETTKQVEYPIPTRPRDIEVATAIRKYEHAKGTIQEQREIKSVQDLIKVREELKGIKNRINELPEDTKVKIDNREVSKEEAIKDIDNSINNINKTYVIWNTYVKGNVDPNTGQPIWEKIPKKKWVMYPGADKKFADYQTYSQKGTLLNRAFNRRYVEKAVEQYSSDIPGDLPEGAYGPIQDFKRRVLYRNLEYQKKYPNKNQRELLTMAVIDILWEEFTDPSAYEKYYESLNPVERIGLSFMKGLRDTAVGVITFPEFLIEEVGGRILTGSAIDVPLGRQTLGKITQQFGGTPGAIGITSKYVVGKATGQEPDISYETGQIKKYPIEFLFATMGEVGGTITGSKVLHIGKTAVQRGIGRLYSPIATRFPSIEVRAQQFRYYSPKNVLSRAWARFRGAKEVAPDEWLGKSDASGFVRSHPSKTMRGFERYPGETTGTYKFGHSTGYRWRSGRLIRAKTAVGERPGEMPGVSVSPKGMVQPRFLRVGPELKPSYSSKISFLPKIRRSAVVSGEYPFRQLPRSMRYSTQRATEYMKTYPKRGYIATKHYLGGFEPEAKIAPGLRYIRTGTPEWFTYKGEFIPVDFIKIGGKIGKVSIPQKVSNIATGAFTYSYGPRPTSIIGSSATGAISYPRYSYGRAQSYRTKPSSGFRASIYDFSNYTYSMPTKPSTPLYSTEVSEPSIVSSSKLSIPSYPYYPYKPYEPSPPSPPPSSPIVSSQSIYSSYPYYSKPRYSRGSGYKWKKRRAHIYGEREWAVKPFSFFKIKPQKQGSGTKTKVADIKPLELKKVNI